MNKEEVLEWLKDIEKDKLEIISVHGLSTLGAQLEALCNKLEKKFLENGEEIDLTHDRLYSIVDEVCDRCVSHVHRLARKMITFLEDEANLVADMTDAYILNDDSLGEWFGNQVALAIPLLDSTEKEVRVADTMSLSIDQFNLASARKARVVLKFEWLCPIYIVERKPAQRRHRSGRVYITGFD